jgi:hypothetical protein
MKALLGVLFLLFTMTFAQASETDNFTQRELKNDAREWLNEQMNQALQQAVQKAKPGDPTSLHKNLFKTLGGLFWAKIELWSDDPNSPAEHLAFADSIFRDVGEVHGDENIIRRFFKFKNYYSSGRYRIDNIVFGADKLGHFLQLGYAMYFAKMRKEDPRFRDARPFYVRFAEVLSGDKKFRENTNLQGDALVFAYSRFQENGDWGYTGPMARSYGDMAANVEGYRFWSNLTDGPHPYVKMKADGSWQQVRNFDWSDYVNLAWDEAVNRTDYHERIKEKVEARIQQVLGESCSSLPSCTAIFDRYGEDAVHIFNNKCERVFQ